MTVIPRKRVWNGCICVSVYATQGIVCVPPRTTAFLFCHAFSFFMQPRKHDSEVPSTTTSGFKRWNHSAVSQEVQLDFTQSLQCPPHCTLCFKVKLLPMIFWILIINIILIINKSLPVEKKKMFITSSWSQVDVLVDVNSQKLNRKKKKKTPSKASHLQSWHQLFCLINESQINHQNCCRYIFSEWEINLSRNLIQENCAKSFALCSQDSF